MNDQERYQLEFGANVREFVLRLYERRGELLDRQADAMQRKLGTQGYYVKDELPYRLEITVLGALIESTEMTMKG